MVCFASSSYTFDVNSSPLDRLFCDNFDDFVAKIKKYVPPTSAITIEGYQVKVQTSYPCIMRHLLPQAHFSTVNVSNEPWMVENGKILSDCVDRRVSLGGLEMFVSSKFNKSLTNEQAVQVLSMFKSEVTHMYVRTHMILPMYIL